MLRHLSRDRNPGLLVGFETRDDAAVFAVSDNLALVQTVDFFTPIVDDPYAYGRIAAANSLSDVYAMGGEPLTALNISCFDPDAAPAEVWADVFRGIADTCAEAGVALVGGHSVVDKEPKFGLAVTGKVDPALMFQNTGAKAGDAIWLSKPLGTGIVTTAAKADGCSSEVLDAAIRAMMELNRDACNAARDADCRCGTDVTGFGLVGHLFNVASASGVQLEVEADALPLLPEVAELVARGFTTGGAGRNREYVGTAFESELTSPWIDIAFDPQTSGGLAVFVGSDRSMAGMAKIGHVTGSGEPKIRLI